MPKLIRSQMLGENACGLVITGDPRNQEPEHVRIQFPFGDVEVTRATDGAGCDYWVHMRVNRDGVMSNGIDPAGVILDARLDQTDKHASEADLGDFNRPELYHLAVRVGAKDGRP